MHPPNLNVYRHSGRPDKIALRMKRIKYDVGCLSQL